MNKDSKQLHFALIAVIAFAMTISELSYAGYTKDSKTLENLQAAFNGESNGRAKYLAYAKKS